MATQTIISLIEKQLKSDELLLCVAECTNLTTSFLHHRSLSYLIITTTNLSLASAKAIKYSCVISEIDTIRIDPKDSHKFGVFVSLGEISGETNELKAIIGAILQAITHQNIGNSSSSCNWDFNLERKPDKELVVIFTEKTVKKNILNPFNFMKVLFPTQQKKDQEDNTIKVSLDSYAFLISSYLYEPYKLLFIGADAPVFLFDCNAYKMEQLDHKRTLYTNSNHTYLMITVPFFGSIIEHLKLLPHTRKLHYVYHSESTLYFLIYLDRELTHNPIHRGIGLAVEGIGASIKELERFVNNLVAKLEEFAEYFPMTSLSAEYIMGSPEDLFLEPILIHLDSAPFFEYLSPEEIDLALAKKYCKLQNTPKIESYKQAEKDSEISQILIFEDEEEIQQNDELKDQTGNEEQATEENIEKIRQVSLQDKSLQNREESLLFYLKSLELTCEGMVIYEILFQVPPWPLTYTAYCNLMGHDLTVPQAESQWRLPRIMNLLKLLLKRDPSQRKFHGFI